MELRLAYNFNKNKYSANFTDFYDEQQTDANMLYDNKRHSGSFNIDFSNEYANNSSLIAGSHSTLIMDDINNIAENPLFKHRSYNQYMYMLVMAVPLSTCAIMHLSEWREYGQRQAMPATTISVQGAMQV